MHKIKFNEARSLLGFTPLCSRFAKATLIFFILFFLIKYINRLINKGAVFALTSAELSLSRFTI
ncbi:MAG: hypothetical protein HND52_15290 [Ignavibacteriae bacterium]|nr:hypothetical protein [Ignavibacteriota bacterium]